MVLAFLGETALKLGSQYFVLRPTFEALYEIECYARATIPQIIYAFEQTKDAALVENVITYGLLARYQQMPDIPKLSGNDWLDLRPDAQQFLIRAMGFAFDDTKNEPEKHIVSRVLKEPVGQMEQGQAAGRNDGATDQMPRAIDPLDWPALYQSATALLGKSEEEFWQMTLCGLMLQSEAYAVAQGFEMTEVGSPATRDELSALMAQFPDSPVAT